MFADAILNANDAGKEPHIHLLVCECVLWQHAVRLEQALPSLGLLKLHWMSVQCLVSSGCQQHQAQGGAVQAIRMSADVAL